MYVDVHELSLVWLHWPAKNFFFRSLLKFRVILIVLRLLNPNMTTKLPIVKGGGIKLFVIKSTIWVFNYNIQCQIMNNVSIYGILTTNRSVLNTHFVFFCVLYSPVGFSLIRLQQQSAKILDSIFHCTSVPFWKCLDGSFAMFIGDGSHVLRKKSKWECRKWSFSDMLQPIWWN